MATKYYAVLTNVGAAKLANATALGAQVEITQMAVGDGNGALPTPNPAQTALVHELRRAPLNSLSIDPNNANQIIAEQVIPEDVGGWWIREIGLFDKDGDMIAVANCAETYKPQLQEGSGRVQVVRMILIVSSTAAVTLKIDPSVVLATRQYVDSQIIVAKSYADGLMSEHLESENPHPQYPVIEKALQDYVDAGLLSELIENLGLRTLYGSRVFTSSGSWTCPENVTTVYLSGCGGGGGGGGGGGAPDANTKTSSSGGGGGAGIATIKQTVTVVPGNVYTITIGSGGSGGNGGASAGNGSYGTGGGSTSFGSLLTLNGGGRGSYGMAATGSSGTPVGGDGGFPGGSTGTTGSQNLIVPSVGGAGGSGPFGTGAGASRGSTGAGSSAGSGSSSPNGSGYGAGGGGGAGTLGATGTAGNNGSAGTNGILILEW